MSINVKTKAALKPSKQCPPTVSSRDAVKQISNSAKWEACVDITRKSGKNKSGSHCCVVKVPPRGWDYALVFKRKKIQQLLRFTADCVRFILFNCFGGGAAL